MLIPARYNGPNGSGNGGYTCGLLAQLLGGDAATTAAPLSPSTAQATQPSFPTAQATQPSFPTAQATQPSFPTAQVTLRMPPPLETPLTVERGTVERGTVGPEVRGPAAGGPPQQLIRVYAGTVLVAEALAVPPVTAAVPPAGLATAADASRSYPGFTAHPFPACYVCGPQRPRGDGLRVFPGRLPDGRTAAPFTVPAEVSPAMVWAALDCPGGWAVIETGQPYVLGRMAATLSGLPHPGEVCVVVGHCDQSRGRKAHVRTSLYGPAGALLATARATWIAVGGTGAGVERSAAG